MCVFQTKEKGKGKESMLLHRKAFTTKHAGLYFIAAVTIAAFFKNAA